MKLIINKDSILEAENNFFGLEILTDNHIYSLFENHKDTILLLKNAFINSIDIFYKKKLEYENISGILILKDNIITVLKLK